ncbi:cytochrome b/b6 domain-containing protein [Tianweitania sp. BSSL-BM11]|uniref:Cytochrome b/b6 domain-containing protein n=1 Tax=Tianweitania aestuarii TaxID=2814886 RepID=A0ABS5RR94_9HYPH|nr:cytochrome b/b6 domain-containing protein [Tianweitania aestuarii]
MIAGLILFNYFYSEGMGAALHAAVQGRVGAALPINPTVHVAVGVSVLVLTLLRLALRISVGVPAVDGTGWSRVIAKVGHKVLYLLMIAVPAIGAVTWFERFSELGDVHAILANALMLVALGHALTALFHQFILKDGLLMRMIRVGHQ